MAIFEFNEIETIIGKDSIIWNDIFLSFGGIVLGFLLSEGKSLLNSKKEIKKIGKSFDFEIFALKYPLGKQIVAINDVKRSLSNYENITPSLFIVKNLEYVKSLDRRLVNEYLKNKYGKEDLKRIRLIYNSLNVIDLEMERYMKFYEEFNLNLNNNYNQFRSTLNEYARSSSEFNLLIKSNGEKDNYIDSIIELFKNTVFKEDVLSNIMPLESSLLEKLIPINLNNFGHPYYSTSRHLNQKAFDIIMNIKIDNQSFIRKLDNIIKSLSNCYEIIYNQKLSDTDLQHT
ncbi:MAG: hypothetical protein A2033_14285 [Bacteroidetes bacterium GWA2_31_9]|nr:MAG: hypothetical protein A2033_14285 [Bacteroidetes bacterium GWA2_31_9]